jgi:glycosyltransferase involved in cell wall biosynthesis
MPIASVLVPMRNAEPYVAAALASILAETAIDIEVVVVDDGSSDGSRTRVLAADDGRIRLIDGPERGIAACLNAGLQAARGDFVLRCDADDLYPPGRIRRQIEWLARHAGYAAVCGSFSTLDGKGRVLADLTPGAGAEAADIGAELLEGRTRTHLGTFAIRTGAARAAGGFREYFETAEDLDFQFRLAEQGEIHYLPENAYFYRLHGESITHGQDRGRRIFFEGMARDLCRQRRESGKDDLQKGTPPAPPRREGRHSGDVEEHIQGMLLGEAWRQHALGHRRRAALLGYRALLAKPLCLGAWKSCAALLLK